MLCAQAMQADGASNRNILLGHAVGVLLGQRTAATGAPSGGGPRAYLEFRQKEVIAWLNLLDLAQTSSLSVLAVELLPFGTVQFRTDASPAAAPTGAVGVPHPPLPNSAPIRSARISAADASCGLHR